MSEAHEKVLALAELRGSQPLALHTSSTALLVVDMQRYFLNPDSPYCRYLESRVPGYTGYLLGEVETRVVPTLQKLVAAFREMGSKVIWSMLASEEVDGSDLSAPMANLNRAGAEQGFSPIIPWQQDHWAWFPPQLLPRDDEGVILKPTYGAFAPGRLQTLLEEEGIGTLVLGGVVTNVCVEATAREAVDRNLGVVLVEDACAAYSPEVHQASLLSFQAVFGQVVSADNLLRHMEQDRAPSNEGAIQPPR